MGAKKQLIRSGAEHPAKQVPGSAWQRSPTSSNAGCTVALGLDHRLNYPGGSASSQQQVERKMPDFIRLPNNCDK
jgi:hypothetical protein